MKKYRLIIGIDISKSKLDACFMADPSAKDFQFLVVSNGRQENEIITYHVCIKCKKARQRDRFVLQKKN